MSIDPGGFTASDPSMMLDDRCRVANAIMVAVRNQLRPRIGIETEDSGQFRFINLIWTGKVTLRLQATVGAPVPLITMAFTRLSTGKPEEVLRQWSINTAGWGALGSISCDKTISLFAKQIVDVVQSELSRL